MYPTDTLAKIWKDFYMIIFAVLGNLIYTLIRHVNDALFILDKTGINLNIHEQKNYETNYGVFIQLKST